MNPRLILTAFLTLVSLSASEAATLHFARTDSTTQIRSVFNKKILYLDLKEAAAKLAITIKEDTAAGVIVLCTAQNCVPVYLQDAAEVQKAADSSLLVRTDDISSALGCTFEVKKKKDVYLSCPEGLKRVPVGSKEGDAAPGFRLRADTVTTASLTELLARKPVLVVFFRNGDWDPFSKLLLKMVQNNLDSIREAGYDVVAIHGYEAKTAMKWKKDLRLTYPLLADEFSAVIRAYDVLDRPHIPLPSVFAIDRNGIIRLRYLFDLSGPPDFSAVFAKLKTVR